MFLDVVGIVWLVSQMDCPGQLGTEEVEGNLWNSCNAFISDKGEECRSFLGKCGNGWT